MPGKKTESPDMHERNQEAAMSERPGVRGNFRGRADKAVKFPREDEYDDGQGEAWW